MSLAIAISMRTNEDKSQAARIALDGTLDTATAPLLEKELAAVFGGPTQILIFDLANLTFLSSGGVRVLLAARKRVMERGGSCVMLKTQPRVEKTFEIIEALDGMTFFNNDEALDTFLHTLQKPSAA